MNCQSFKRSKLYLLIAVSLVLHVLACILGLVTSSSLHLPVIAVISAFMAGITVVVMLKSYLSKEDNGVGNPEDVQYFNLFLRWRQIQVTFIISCLAISWIGLFIAAFDDIPSVKATAIANHANDLTRFLGSLFYNPISKTISLLGNFGISGAALMIGALLLISVVVVFWCINMIFTYRDAKIQAKSIIEGKLNRRPYFVHLYVLGGIDILLGLLVLTTSYSAALVAITQGAYAILMGVLFSKIQNKKLG